MANSVTARFNDDCKVHVAMSDDTTVTKAVIIDADGNETDIGGGGGDSDFSIVKVTFDVTDFTPDPENPVLVPLPIVRTGDPGIISVNELQEEDTVTYDVAIYKGYTIVYSPSIFSKFAVVSGSAITSGAGSSVTISGNCSLRYYPTE